MQKIRTFWRTLVDTFTRPSSYRDFLAAPFSSSLKFFMFYYFLMSVIATAIVAVVVLAPFGRFVKNVPTMIIESYPSELVVTINNGEVSTNVKEPHVIPLADIQKVYDKYSEDVLGDTSEPKNLVVIDTKGKIEDFGKYQTVALVTKRHVTLLDDDGKIQTMELKEIDNFVVNQNLVQTMASKIRPFLPYVVPVVTVFVFLGMLAYFITAKLMYLLFGALCLLICSKLLSYPLTYGKSYQMGLHLSVVTGTLFALVSLLQLNIQFPFLHTSVFVLIGVLILNVLKKQISSQVVATGSKKSK